MRDNFSRRRVDQVLVFIHVHGAVVRGSAGQRAGELRILRQVGGIHGKLLHAVVRRIPRRIRGSISRVPRPDERARGVLRRDVRLAFQHFRAHRRGRRIARQQVAVRELDLQRCEILWRTC